MKVLAFDNALTTIVYEFLKTSILETKEMNERNKS